MNAVKKFARQVTSGKVRPKDIKTVIQKWVPGRAAPKRPGHSVEDSERLEVVFEVDGAKHKVTTSDQQRSWGDEGRLVFEMRDALMNHLNGERTRLTKHKDGWIWS